MVSALLYNFPYPFRGREDFDLNKLYTNSQESLSLVFIENWIVFEYLVSLNVHKGLSLSFLSSPFRGEGRKEKRNRERKTRAENGSLLLDNRNNQQWSNRTKGQDLPSTDPNLLAGSF